MSWTADRQAALNVGRAMASPRGREIMRELGFPTGKLIPAVSTDSLRDLARHFDGGRGLVIYSRSKDVIDFIAFEPGANYRDGALSPDFTVGDMVEQMDRNDAQHSAWDDAPSTQHRQLTLA